VEDLVQVLTRFHRDIVVPDIKRIVGDAVDGAERRLRDEMHSLFDALAQQINDLKIEYHMLVAGVKRVEERLDRVDARLDAIEKSLEKMALRSELAAIHARMDSLQEHVRTLQARLED
jgi:predicted  nucleic acid-binding Zn-ribbon protein